ncbi:hypothetical protein KJ840_02215 [Patescibacteria group bacterium]|nr:hypothetical protein [Patescibacteria group bacterium]
MGRIIKIILISIILFSFVAPTVQAADEVKVYFFYGDGCPHCASEEQYLNKLKIEYPGLEIKSFEIWHNKANLNLLKKIGEEMNVDVSGIPFTIIGEKTFSGYLNEQTTGKEIELQVERCLALNCPDPVGDVISNQQQENNQKETGSNNDSLEKLSLPIFGEVELKNISLPILTIMIGALDGFNPCAMWVLLFLISLLLNMGDRRRMWILGGAFILASGAVYFMFMAAWLNILLFLGFIIWIRVLIGLVALGSGIYNLKEYKKNKDAACKVIKPEKRQRTFAKLKAITQNKKFIIALFGIILLAVAVNLVELVCSAGFPAVYTHILTLSDLSPLSYYLYIFLYIFIFMLDDMLVFVIAMITLRATGITAKYTRFSYLIGGILMIVLGLLLLLKPGWLMFG